MSALEPVYSVETARAAEQRLLAQQSHEDELMKKAAAAVSDVARTLCPAGRVLILAGAGGNGGDGLYTGAHLALSGYTVHAVLAADTAHAAALETFRAAGGELALDGELSLDNEYDLVIDAIAGLGSTREVSADMAAAAARGTQVLAVDSPTGVGTARSITADVTITFGRARSPHARFAECGEVVIADIGLGEVFDTFEPVGFYSYEPTLGARVWPEGVRPVATTGALPSLLPGINDNKYTHGVTGIAAGSARFPGAAIMATAGAVHTTTSMVMTVEGEGFGGSRAYPEVVPVADVAAAHKVQAWVVGPGRGTDAAALAELETILESTLPVVIDADALTLIANHPHLHTKLHGAVLTPHAGEFARLTDGSQQELSDSLGCHILLKGRITRITSPGVLPVSVNTGNSFAATAGSGDVLAGIIGALLAKGDERGMQRLLLTAVALHAHAAARAALQYDGSTPIGYAPTHAMDIARAIPGAIARLIAKRNQARI